MWFIKAVLVFHCLAVPDGLSKFTVMKQAELGQTTWSLHMGWQGSLLKAVAGAKLDVSICPHFLCGRSSWCLLRAGWWLGCGRSSAGGSCLLHLWLWDEGFFSVPQTHCHLPVASSLGWPLSFVYSVARLHWDLAPHGALERTGKLSKQGCVCGSKSTNVCFVLGCL